MTKKDMLIAVPYRDREEHLRGFLDNAPQYFAKLGLTYDILICELEQGGDWNAGLSCNALKDFIKDRSYEWLYVHHVDVWPTEGPWSFPKDKEVFFNLGDYGSCLMKLDAFLEVGGYSNSFWGWGGEDNDLYGRLKYKGYDCIDKEKGEVKYNTKFQSHERKFNGRNYANGLKLLYTSFNKNDIADFEEHGSTKNLQEISEDIYKLTVVPKKISPDKTQNKKLLITFSEGHTRFEMVAAFVKSAAIYAAYEFDVVVVVADAHPDAYYIEQLEAHGAKVFRPETKISNLFIDRFRTYKEFLELNPAYEYVLHTDLTDVYFQDNPLSQLDPSKLTLVSEGIAVKDQSWNFNMIRGMYPPEIVDKVQDRSILCGGVIGGPRDLFVQLADKIVAEYSNPIISCQTGGVDQLCLMKSVYYDKFLDNSIVIKQIEEPFCINLHVFRHERSLVPHEIHFEDKLILNEARQRYAIVHQFNRFPELYTKVVNHFNQYFAPV